MSSVIAVIAAHPDDEVLGCGASLARHVASGDEVHVLIVAEGVTSRAATRSRSGAQAELSQLARSGRQAHSILGSGHLEMLALPDNRLDSIDRLEVIKAIETFLGKVGPRTVYTHFCGDLNIDHRIVSEAVRVACRPIPGSKLRELLMFEVPSSTEWGASPQPAFNPNYFIDVSATLEKKLEALRAYASEMKQWPHARSLEAVQALAQWRGASVGVAAAEAFILARGLL
jgi:LmbE family N-acetylglucosaminyl deacetylase